MPRYSLKRKDKEIIEFAKEAILSALREIYIVDEDILKNLIAGKNIPYDLYEKSMKELIDSGQIESK